MHRSPAALTRLGIAPNGAAGGAVHVTMNISAPDAVSFQRSQTQVAANDACDPARSSQPSKGRP